MSLEIAKILKAHSSILGSENILPRSHVLHSFTTSNKLSKVWVHICFVMWKGLRGKNGGKNLYAYHKHFTSLPAGMPRGRARAVILPWQATEVPVFIFQSIFNYGNQT